MSLTRSLNLFRLNLDEMDKLLNNVLDGYCHEFSPVENFPRQGTPITC